MALISWKDKSNGVLSRIGKVLCVSIHVSLLAIQPWGPQNQYIQMWANTTLLYSAKFQWQVKDKFNAYKYMSQQIQELCNIGNGIQQTPKTISSSLPPTIYSTHFTDETTKCNICYIWVELLLSCFFSSIVAQASLTDLVAISISSSISPILFYPQSNFVGCCPHFCSELQCFYSWLSLSQFSRFFYDFQTNLLLHLNKVEQL